MKIFIKLLILLLVLAFVTPFVMNGSDGKPLMSLSQIKLPKMVVPTIDTLKRKLSSTQTTDKDGIQVYKWQDEKGVIHYSDHKVSMQPSELTLIKGITILPSTSNTVNHKIETNTTSSTKGMTLPSPTTIPLADIPKLIQDAKQVEQLLHERKLHQDSIIDSTY